MLLLNSCSLYIYKLDREHAACTDLRNYSEHDFVGTGEFTEFCSLSLVDSAGIGKLGFLHHLVEQRTLEDGIFVAVVYEYTADNLADDKFHTIVGIRHHRVENSKALPVFLSHEAGGRQER